MNRGLHTNNTITPTSSTGVADLLITTVSTRWFLQYKQHDQVMYDAEVHHHKKGSDDVSLLGGDPNGIV